MKQYLNNYLNEIGGTAVKVIAIILIVLLLLGGGLGVYYQYFDNATYTDEQIAKATELAQNEFAEASTIAGQHHVAELATALQTLGYEENKKDNSSTIYEKKENNESDYYILMSVQPHESYANLSRVLVQVFDKDQRSKVHQLSNVLTWKE